MWHSISPDASALMQGIKPSQRLTQTFSTGLIRGLHVLAQIAQLVEQGIENPRVGGSIPSLGTITFSNVPSSQQTLAL